jgi:hypothetical protein
VRFGADWVESGRFSARAGRRVSLLRVDATTTTWHASVDGMLWAWLSTLPHFNFPLETVDGSFGLSLDAVHGRWSGRLRYGHASSHLGDGESDVDERRIVYSREAVSLVGAFAPTAAWRVYAGPTFVVRGDPHTSAFQLQLGGEARAGRVATALQPYAAFDLRMKSENANRVNQSYEVGLRLGGSSGDALRIAAGYESGISERGQLWRTEEQFFRLSIAFGE